jgi:hypothetical protein
MSTAIQLTESIQDRVINAVETSQRWTTSAVKAMTSTLDGFSATRTAVPFADSLPTPAETIKVSFGFAERLLSAQREFVTDLLALATAPATPPAAPARAARR